MEESDGVSSTQRVVGSDTSEDTEGMPLTVGLREYGSCEKPQEAPIHLSKERTTMLACLQEL